MMNEKRGVPIGAVVWLKTKAKFLAVREGLPGRGLRHCLMAIALVILVDVFRATAGQTENVISLAGTWRFRLDLNSVGATNGWFKEVLDDSITLPGTTDTNQKGVFKDERAVDRLSRVWYWKGRRFGSWPRGAATSQTFLKAAAECVCRRALMYMV